MFFSLLLWINPRINATAACDIHVSISAAVHPCLVNLDQARREPQRGRETIIAGPYHNLISYAPRWRRGRKRGEGCPLTIRLYRGLGERRKLTQRDPGGNGFYAYLRSERSHLEHHFQYFERWRGPQTSRGPGKLPLPLSTDLIWTIY